MFIFDSEIDVDAKKACLKTLFESENIDDIPLSFLTHRPEFITLTPPLHFARDEVFKFVNDY